MLKTCRAEYTTKLFAVFFTPEFSSQDYVNSQLSKKK